MKSSPADIAAACAGVLGQGGPVFDTPVADFEQVMGAWTCAARSLSRARRQTDAATQDGRDRAAYLDGLQAEHGMFSSTAFEGRLNLSTCVAASTLPATAAGELRARA